MSPRDRFKSRRKEKTLNKRRKSSGLSLGRPKVQPVGKPKNRVKRKQPSRFTTMFGRRQSSKKDKSVKRARKRRGFATVIKYLGLLLLGSLALFLTYKGVMWAINTRAAKTAADSGIYESIVGFENVPQYPKSESILEDYDSDANTIKEFQASGRSIYRITRGGSIENAFEFYKENLPSDTWDHVLSVPRTSTESMYGEYWVNNEDDFGLRIYDRVNDIWYERISTDEAITGLAEQLFSQVERELIISAGNGIDLLPDFPWQLTVPNEYVVSYFATDEGDLRGVTFKELGSSNKFTLEPISPINGNLDDIYLEQYVSILNIRGAEQEEPISWNIVNSVYTNVGGKNVLKGSIVSPTDSGYVYILHNDKVEYTYALLQEQEDPTFVNFLIRNISVKNADYTGDEYNLDD